jgi:Tol biopolymer transport system component/tRNA A-37 threonylcarbamoyl transferase component Bud32
VSSDNLRDTLQGSLGDRYRIEREIGAGGMATVHLAHDLRHDRRVAIKVLHPELSAVLGAERFLAEIKTTAALQHPHILPLFDSGSADGLLFYVMPLVEGETLRARLAREKQLPIADAVRIAREVANALDYAHRRGVIHRDIKPENILLHEGQALVADFGIALAVQSAGGQRMTQTGLSLGTPQYMSPEQAMGEREITARSDVYSLGAVTYEMLVGEPPFTGPTTQAIFAKVMTEEPRSLVDQRKSVPPDVETAVLTALEKLPADRFGSAAEFAATIEGRGAAGSTRPVSRRTAAHARPIARWVLAAGMAVAAALAIGFIGGRASRSNARTDTVAFFQKTFDERQIFNARFGPDGKTIVYSATVTPHTRTPAVFVVRPDYAEPQPLGLPDTHLLSISSRGELAVLVRASFRVHRLFKGTLARVPLGGGAPRELLEDVREADWSPDGSQLAVIRDAGGTDRLEFPIGTLLLEQPGYLSDPRVSPDGKHIAFVEHKGWGDDRGRIAVVNLSGKKTVLTPVEFSAVEGMAWSRASDEVFFSAQGAAHQMVVHGATLDGALRVVLSGAGGLTMHDVASDGRWIVTRDDKMVQLFVRAPGAAEDREAGWLDYAFRPVLSADGKLLAFGDASGEAGVNYSVILRKTEGGSAARLGEGWPASFSADGKSLLAVVPSTPPRVIVYPTAAGSERQIDAGTLASITDAEWGPGDRSVLLCGNEPSKPLVCVERALDGGAGRPAGLKGLRYGSVAPDGRRMLIEVPGQPLHLGTIGGDSARPIAGLSATDNVVRWSPDGRALWLRRRNSFVVDRFDLETGRRDKILDVPVPVTPAIVAFSSLVLADDPRVFAYSTNRASSALFLVQGAR